MQYASYGGIRRRTHYLISYPLESVRRSPPHWEEASKFHCIILIGSSRRSEIQLTTPNYSWRRLGGRGRRSPGSRILERESESGSPGRVPDSAWCIVTFYPISFHYKAHLSFHRTLDLGISEALVTRHLSLRSRSSLYLPGSP